MIILSKKRITLILSCVLLGIFTFMLQSVDLAETETVPTVTLPANHALPSQSTVWMFFLLLWALPLPLPIIWAYLPLTTLYLPYTCCASTEAIVPRPSACE